MNLTYVRKYQRFLRKTQGIFYKNPLLSLGLALPLVVIPSYGLTGTTAISAVMLVCFIPTVLIASLLRKKVPQPWRAVLYPLISCLLLIPSRMMVKNVSPLIFDSLGVYFSLICVNSLLIYTVEKVQLQKPSQALGFALRQWLGATLVAFVCGAIRELSATGSLWGFPVLQNTPRIPTAQMALGGFLLLGFFAAFCRLVHRVVLYFTMKAGENAAQASAPREVSRNDLLNRSDGGFSDRICSGKPLFTRAVDIPGLYEKRSLRQLLTVGGLLTLVTALSSIPAYLFNAFFRAKVLYTGLKIGFLPLTSLSTLGMLLINGAVMLLVYYLVKHLRPQLFMQVKDALPFYGINSVTLSSLLIASRMEHHLPVFLLLWLLSGCGSRLYRRSVDSLVGAQSPVPHPYSQNLPRVPHHLLGALASCPWRCSVCWATSFPLKSPLCLGRIP